MIYFSMGYWVIGLMAIYSIAAAAVGLACLRHADAARSRRFQLVWLFFAAGAFGGVGVGMPVFDSLIGVSVRDGQLLYDPMLTTLASAASGTTVMISLVVTGLVRRWARLAAGAIIMGIGLASVNHLMLSAIRVQGVVQQDPVSVYMAYAVAILLSAVTLWFALSPRPLPARVVMVVLYGVTVIVMHYIELTGLHIQIDPAATTPTGDDLFDSFVPFHIISSLSLAIPIAAMLLAPDKPTKLRTTLLPADPDSGRSPAVEHRTPVG